MDLNEKLAQLIMRVLNKTRTKEIQWSETVDEGVFQASFSNYSVQISYKETSYHAREYIFGIYNQEGKLVEEVDQSQLNFSSIGTKAFKILDEIYQIARRQVLGVENAINDLLAELGEDDENDQKITEDEIPF